MFDLVIFYLKVKSQTPQTVQLCSTVKTSSRNEEANLVKYGRFYVKFINFIEVHVDLISQNITVGLEPCVVSD